MDQIDPDLEIVDPVDPVIEMKDEGVDPAEAFDIPVPVGDPWFDPYATGNVTIPLNRSYYEEHDGVREQVNDITAYIDASNVYGSDAARASARRRGRAG